MADATRTDIGFQGGQVLTLRLADGIYEELVKALADDSSGRWHSVTSDDERVELDLSQVVYVRREGAGQRVGF